MPPAKRGGQPPLKFPKAKIAPAAPVDNFTALVDQYHNHLLTTTNELASLLDKNLTPGILLISLNVIE